MKKNFIIKIRTYGYKKFMRYKDWLKDIKKIVVDYGSIE
jgi:hypothetical protein